MTKTAQGSDEDDVPGALRMRGRPKARPDAQERQRIVVAARELFLEAGYGGTRMDEVAARCGVSKRTLYRLFPAKTDLFCAMVADHRRSMLALPRSEDEDLPLADALAAIFRLDDAAAQASERLAFIRLALVESDRFSEIGEAIVREGAEPARQLLGAWLACQQHRGRLRAFPTSTMARMLMDMVLSVLVKRFPGDPLMSSEERVRHARLCIEVFLNGCATEAATVARSG